MRLTTSFISLTTLATLFVPCLLAQLSPALPDVGDACPVAHATRQGSMTADAILAKAVDRASLHDPVGTESRYSFQIDTITTKTDKEGRPSSSEKTRWAVYPVAGHPFRRLLSKNDQPLTTEERAQDNERERKFRREHARFQQDGATPSVSPKDPEADELRFDASLVARYETRLVSCSTELGRRAYVIQYRPRRNLPKTKHRLDAVLKRVEGEIWIDVETSEIQQVVFALGNDESVRVGPRLLSWLGKVSELRGRLVRSPLANGDWFPTSLRFEVGGRAFLRSFRLEEHTQWSAFTKALPSIDRRPPPKPHTGTHLDERSKTSRSSS